MKIPAAAVGVEGSSVYFAQDEILTLRELLYALLLESTNDDAVAITIALYGVEEAPRRKTLFGRLREFFRQR